MNKQIIIGIVATILIGAGGWFYFSSKSQPQEPHTTKKDGIAQGVIEKKLVATTEVPKVLTKREQATAHSFAEKILKLLQNRDYGKVYDLLTDEDKAAESKTDFVKRVTEASGATTITSWQIKEVLEEQGGASVQYVDNYTNSVLGSGSETGILTLVQKNEKWFWSIGAIDAAMAVIKGLGDEIVLATVKFTVNSVREQLNISDKYGSTASAKAGTKFIVIDISITNITKTSFSFPTDILVDNQDRQFETYNNTIGNIDNYLNVRDLPPSIPERGVVVYEIPTDATSYWFIVAKAGTNEVYKVVLK